MTMLSRLTRTALIAIPAAALVLAPGAMSPAHASASPEVTMPDPTVERGLDTVVLRTTGKKVQGKILELTEDEVKMTVIVAGISASQTYKRSDVIAISFGEPLAETGMTKKTADEAGAAKTKQRAQDKVFDDTTKFYLVDLEGEFGRHISETPIRDLFEDVDETFDDLVWDDRTRQYVVDPNVRDQHVVVLRIDNTSDAFDVFQTIIRAESIYPIVEHERVAKGRRVIVWAEDIRGGAIFLALSCPEIYFMRNATMAMGDALDLDEFDSGDDMVDEKLISARLGHAIGAVNVGGYEYADIITRALIRGKHWLSLRTEGGRAYLTDMEPPADSYVDEDKTVWQHDGYTWEVLTDSGEGTFDDDDEALFVNDLLIIDFGLASTLGISKGLAETVEDLAVRLGVEDNYTVLEEHGGRKAMEKWSDGIERALDLVGQDQNRFGRVRGSLIRELQGIEVKGEWDDRRKARGRQMSIYKQIISTLTQFEEALDPRGQQRSQLRMLIEQIRNDIENDPRPRPTGR